MKNSELIGQNAVQNRSQAIQFRAAFWSGIVYDDASGAPVEVHGPDHRTRIVFTVVDEHTRRQIEEANLTDCITDRVDLVRRQDLFVPPSQLSIQVQAHGWPR